MLSHRSEGLAKLLIVCQLLLAVGVFWASAAITYGFFTTEVEAFSELFWVYAGALVTGLILEAFSRNPVAMRVRLRDRNPLRFHPLALRQTLFACGALLVYLAAAKDMSISRTLLAFLFPGMYLMLLCSAYFLPRILARNVFLGIREERILVVGSAARFEKIRPWLESKKVMGFRIVGLLSDDKLEPRATGGIVHLGSIKNSEQVIEQYQPSQILLLQLAEQLEDHRSLIALADKFGLRVLILNTLQETLDHPVVHFEDEGCHFVSLRREPLENPFNRVIKRSVDIAVSAPIVLFVLPVLSALVWLIQRRQSPGPLFFFQERAGFQNDRFHLVKFRTMHAANAEAARQATSDDARVFSGGRWLRKLSLDEVPQFWNVLMGEMSVVGPRPHMVEHHALFAAQLRGYSARHFVKPGITGLAQVRGFRGEIRSEADLSNRLRSDLFYVESWTLGTDLLVIARTVWQMLFPPSTAY
jgi:putative colanic acid biosynthesis UDP-glucose lipid carrier transferase